MRAQAESATASTQEVTVTRVFDAPRRAVWDAWTTPRGLASWFGTPPYSTPLDRVDMDVRAGGRWEATQVSEIDGAELPFMGHYLDVREPDLLVLTFEDPSDPDCPEMELATVRLEEESSQTRMTFNQKGSLPAEEYELLAEGYSLFFDRMEEHLSAAR